MKSIIEDYQETRPVLLVALLVSFILVAFTAFFWSLIDIFTPFLMPFLMGAVWIFFIAVFVWSLIHVCRKKRFKRPKAYAPLVVQIVSAVVVITVPFTSIMLDIDFRLRHKEREAVVSKVLSGELKPNIQHNSSLIHLPDRYRHLSKGGGVVVVERHDGATYIFFYTFRGILDNFSGFMYRSDDTPPRDGDFAGDFFESKRLEKNWYWAAAR